MLRGGTRARSGSSSATPEYVAIAAGGGPNPLFPIDKLPMGREMTQILRVEGIIAVTRNSATRRDRRDDAEGDAGAALRNSGRCDEHRDQAARRHVVIRFAEGW